MHKDSIVKAEDKKRELYFAFFYFDHEGKNNFVTSGLDPPHNPLLAMDCSI